MIFGQRPACPHAPALTAGLGAVGNRGRDMPPVVATRSTRLALCQMPDSVVRGYDAGTEGTRELEQNRRVYVYAEAVLPDELQYVDPRCQCAVILCSLFHARNALSFADQMCSCFYSNLVLEKRGEGGYGGAWKDRRFHV